MSRAVRSAARSPRIGEAALDRMPLQSRSTIRGGANPAEGTRQPEPRAR